MSESKGRQKKTGNRERKYRLDADYCARLDAFLDALGYSSPAGKGRTRRELGKLLIQILDDRYLMSAIEIRKNAIAEIEKKNTQ